MYPKWCVPEDDAIFIVITRPSGLLYHWEVDAGRGFAGINDDAVYVGSTTESLHIRGVNIDQQGYFYRCIADDNGCSTLSAAAKLSVTIPTAISDPAGGLLFGISPNPTKDFISVHIGQQFSVRRIVVRNATGQAVYTDSTELRSIDVRGLAQGLYFVTVETEDVVFNGRFLKE